MLRDASQRLGVTLVGAMLEDPIQEPEYRRAFAALTRDRVNAVIVGDYVENFQNMRVIVDLAAQARLPTVALRKDFVADEVRVGDQPQDRQGAGAHNSTISTRTGQRNHPVMDRRAFITTMGSGLLAAPLGMEAQQAGKVPQIGYLAVLPRS
jgi:hypothetical protein